MSLEKLKRALKLVKETGDKIIFFEDQNSDGLVLMNLKEYEKLSKTSLGLSSEGEKYSENKEIGSLTEDELIDRINRNIAVWKNENQNQVLDEVKIIDSFLDGISEDFEEEEDNLYYYNDDTSQYFNSDPVDLDESSDEESPEEESPADEDDMEEGKGKNNWEIPVTIKKGAQDIEE